MNLGISLGIPDQFSSLEQNQDREAIHRNTDLNGTLGQGGLADTNIVDTGHCDNGLMILDIFNNYFQKRLILDMLITDIP